VTLRIVHAEGSSRNFDVLYSEPIAKARAKLESEFQSFKAEVEAGGA
jgi:hypothetical protein